LVGAFESLVTAPSTIDTALHNMGDETQAGHAGAGQIDAMCGKPAG
jgi:hypothetical protein